ncbi:MAG: hypothetical protein COZ18_14965 [Flexibacter sp. CG_4_10_14_3_um_filter_32_15]|nr:MAG: hypothetical protein COZ18_14965 [Flexibacter sp. CG_4_10_14_3_um_filter_32_15]
MKLFEFAFLIKGFFKIWTPSSILEKKQKINLLLKRMSQDENGNDVAPVELTDEFLQDFGQLMMFQKKMGGAGKFKEFMTEASEAGFLDDVK